MDTIGGIKIVEGNALIDKFMGLPKHPRKAYWMKYHEDWHCLMGVVEKVESTYDEFHGYFGVHISSNSCSIQGTNLRTDPKSFHPAYMSDPNAIFDTKLNSTWYNIVKFIGWWNEYQKVEKDQFKK